MSKPITISICLNLFNFIFAAYLEAESNYLRPSLERNNVVNKGLWLRDKVDRKKSGHFIFKANSLDVDNMLQNNYDAFGGNNNGNSPFFSGYMERNKRSTNEKSGVGSRKKLKCIDKSDCANAVERKFIVKSKFISTLKPSSLFDDYPYEVAHLLNNKNDQLNDFNEHDMVIYNKDGSENQVDNETNVTENIFTETNKDNSTIIKDIYKTNNSHINRTDTIPKRSMNRHEHESQLVKKKELSENLNTSNVTIRKLDRNVFDKEDMVWYNAAPSNMNVYKISSKKEENKKHKPITERGLIKVLSMLTKTFKKIMKHHNNIKKIHNKLYGLNDDFMKNAELLTMKFDDFDLKYSFMLNLNEELKILKDKLSEKEQSFGNKEIDLIKNLKEFENQQKKFLEQQRQFYNVQKLMLAQNEKINLRQSAIAKTQSEISHKQNNFARILKKTNQIYVDSKHLSPAKLNTAITKPKITPEKEKIKPLKTVFATTTSTLRPPRTDSVKINLFSIPAFTQLVNQDQMILDEKDYQPVDDLIYKYYFNNTFIDDLMKNKILATFISPADGADRNDVKNKRNEKAKPKSTLLVPVNKTIASSANKIHRYRRWIKRSKKNYNKDSKSTATPVILEVPSIIEENKVHVHSQSDNTKGDPIKKDGPFVTMALNFCKEIGQSINVQILNWCVEKALRRLQVIDLKRLPLMAAPTTPANNVAHITKNDAAVHLTETSSTLKLHKQNSETRATTEAFNSVMFFPDNDELEGKLKEYEITPDLEGNVYYDGSLHASDIKRIDGVDSDGFSDVMPGLDSN